MSRGNPGAGPVRKTGDRDTAGPAAAAPLLVAIAHAIETRARHRPTLFIHTSTRATRPEVGADRGRSGSGGIAKREPGIACRQYSPASSRLQGDPGSAHRKPPARPPGNRPRDSLSTPLPDVGRTSSKGVTDEEEACVEAGSRADGRGACPGSVTVAGHDENLPRRRHHHQRRRPRP